MLIIKPKKKGIGMQHKNYILPYNLTYPVYCISSLTGLTFVKQVDNTDS